MTKSRHTKTFLYNFPMEEAKEILSEMFFDRKMKIKEIAKDLGCGVNTIYVRLYTYFGYDLIHNTINDRVEKDKYDGYPNIEAFEKDFLKMLKYSKIYADDKLTGDEAALLLGYTKASSFFRAVTNYRKKGYIDFFPYRNLDAKIYGSIGGIVGAEVRFRNRINKK